MAEIVKSLAGTGRQYVRMQARVKEGKLHIQGKGTVINRPYGIALDVTLHESILKWFEKQEHTEKSLANTDAMYVPIQAKPLSENVVHIQVKGSEFNREYGLAIDTTSPELYKFVTSELDKEE